MRIDQFIPSFVQHDAISNHARQVRRALVAAGFESRIFYQEVDPRLIGRARNFKECDQKPHQDRLILYHASTDSAMAEWLEEAAAAGQAVAINYHNITPAEYFVRWEPHAVASMELARTQLADMRNWVGLAIADSSYNASELEDLGYRHTAVCPILIDLSQFRGQPDGRTMSRLTDQAKMAGPLWLFVGRVSPNKCQHDVLAAFAVYRRLFSPAARLALVGRVASARYHRALLSMADELGVAEAVDLRLSTSHSELLAYYQSADAFVCLSEHEGFCVPIVEAMEMDLPVVAFSGSAVTDTVGSGGVLLDDKDPLAVAVAVDRLLADGERRRAAVTAGRQRLGDYTLDATAARFVDLLRGWSGSDG